MFTTEDGLIVCEQISWKVPLPYKGTATAGGVSTISDTNRLTTTANSNIIDDYFNNYYIKILSGTGSGQVRLISDFVQSTGTVTVSVAWDTQPDTTSIYAITEFPNTTGTLDSATALTAVDAALTEVDDFWNNAKIRITGGTGNGQDRTVVDFTASNDTLTINESWSTTPDSTSTYSLTKGIYQIPLRGEATRSTDHTPVESAAINTNHSRNKSRIGWYSFSNSYPIEWTADGLGVLLKNFFGKYTFTLGTPNTHQHQLADSVAEKTVFSQVGLTLETGGNGYFFTDDSSIVTGITMEMGQPGMMSGTITTSSRDEYQTTAGWSYYPPGPGKDFDNFQVGFTIGTDGAEVTQNVKNMSLNFTKEVEPDFDNTYHYANKWKFGAVALEGTFQMDLEASTVAALETARKANTTQSIVITMTSSVNAQPSSPYTLVLDLPEVQLDYAVEGAADFTTRLVTFNFAAGLDVGSTPITVTETNNNPTLSI